MKANRCATFFAVMLFALAGTSAMAQGNSHGHGNGNGKAKGHAKHGDDDDQGGYYRDHDRDIQAWHEEHRNNLPPGLAKKDQLPPGLEKQLVRRGMLPPGLQREEQPCPPDLERRLPPPPPDSAHVIIGGHIVLLNKKTNIVLDIFHFE
jgi:Ni/Co efflux regulator RcnB